MNHQIHSVSNLLIQARHRDLTVIYCNNLLQQQLVTLHIFGSTRKLAWAIQGGW